MISSKIIACSIKSMTNNFVVVVTDLMSIFCHIRLGMSYLHTFVEEIAPLSDAMTDTWM